MWFHIFLRTSIGCVPRINFVYTGTENNIGSIGFSGLSYSEKRCVLWRSRFYCVRRVLRYDIATTGGR